MAQKMKLHDYLDNNEFTEIFTNPKNQENDREELLGEKVSPYVSYQPKGPQHRQAFYVGQAQLHQTQTNNNAIKDVPTLLEIVVRVQGNDLEAHFCCEDARENLVTGEDDYMLNISCFKSFAFRVASLSTCQVSN